MDLDSQRKGKSVVIKTTTRQTYFLPVAGLVEPENLKPGDLVGVNKDSYLILDTLPSEYDSRVKAMEVDTRPTEQYSDIGGLDKQIQELVEAVVLPNPQGPVHQLGHKASQGRADVRTPRHRQNVNGSSLRSTNTILLPQAGRPSAGADVHRRRSQARERRLCLGQGEGPRHHLHRRAGRHRHQAFRQREGWRQGGSEDYAGTSQPAGWILINGKFKYDAVSLTFIVHNCEIF